MGFTILISWSNVQFTCSNDIVCSGCVVQCRCIAGVMQASLPFSFSKCPPNSISGTLID